MRTLSVPNHSLCPPCAVVSWLLWHKGQGRRCPGFQVEQVTLILSTLGFLIHLGLCQQISAPCLLGAEPKARLFQFPSFLSSSLPPSFSSSRVRECVRAGEGMGWGTASARWHLFSDFFFLLLGLCHLHLEASNLLSPFSGHDLVTAPGT